MKINALLVKPNSLPLEVTIESDLTALQQCVGGNIEAVDLLLGEKVSVFVNEEGKLLNLPVNKYILFKNIPTDIIVGNILITGNDPETGKTVSLSKEDMEKCKNIFSKTAINI